MTPPLGGGAPARSREMTLRVLSATVLIPFGLFVVWKGGPVLGIACAVFAAVMAWEWARMAALRFPLAFAGLAVVPCSIATFLPESYLLPGLTVTAAISVVCVRSARSLITATFGMLYTSGPPLAMFLLRESEFGLILTLVVMALVWVTDISAFFAGRSIGGPLLSPKESPNKRWSGALAAFAASCLFVLLLALSQGWPLLAWTVAALSISVATQLGDLLESLFKRMFGVKDAGTIVPGHGGLLDRVDGLGAAMCYALMVISIAPEALFLLGLRAQ